MAELQERDRRDRAREPLEGEIPDRLRVHEVLDRRHHTPGGEHLARTRLATEAEGEIGHAADRAVVPPPLEADGPDRREPLREPEADVQLVPVLPPADG